MAGHMAGQIAPHAYSGTIVDAGVGRFGAEPPNLQGRFFRKNLFGRFGLNLLNLVNLFEPLW